MESDGDREQTCTVDNLCAVYIRQHVCYGHNTYPCFQRAHHLARDTRYQTPSIGHSGMWPGTQARTLHNKWQETLEGEARIHYRTPLEMYACINQTQEWQGQKVPQGQDLSFLSCPRAPSMVLRQHLLTKVLIDTQEAPWDCALNSRTFLLPFPIFIWTFLLNSD